MFNGIITSYLWQNHLWNIISLALWWMPEREEFRISKSVEVGVRFLINWIESELYTSAEHNRDEFAGAQYMRPFDIYGGWYVGLNFICELHIHAMNFIVKAARICKREWARLMMNLLRRFWRAKPYGLWSWNKKSSAKISLCESGHKEKYVFSPAFLLSARQDNAMKANEIRPKNMKFCFACCASLYVIPAEYLKPCISTKQCR